MATTCVRGARTGLNAACERPAAALRNRPLPMCVQGRVAVIQSLSGTGSLRVGAAFIARWLKGKTVYISNPTWGNHRNIFGDENVEWKYYRCCSGVRVSCRVCGV
jgi:aspartate aminotransferase